MSALFTPRGDRQFRWLVLALLLGPWVLAGSLMAWVRRPAATGEDRLVEQPVPFDHRIHAQGLRIDCRYCHAGALRSRYAGLPPTEACVSCHNPVLLESATFAPVRASLATGRAIPWRRVHRLPDFVFFNHAVHLAAGFTCTSCHGAVDTMQVVRQVEPLTMRWCLDCHRAQSTGADHQTGDRRRLTHCSTCHR